MHAEILSSILEPGSLLVADMDPSRARAVADAVGAEALEIGPAIEAADALVIAASSTAHPELIRAGIERRIPVFCEKPLAAGLEATKLLVDEIEASVASLHH